MQAEFERAAFDLQKGEVSGIVDTASGIHLIQRWVNPAWRRAELTKCLQTGIDKITTHLIGPPVTQAVYMAKAMSECLRQYRCWWPGRPLLGTHRRTCGPSRTVVYDQRL